MSSSRRSIIKPGQEGSLVHSLLEYEEDVDNRDAPNTKLLTWMKAVTEELGLLDSEINETRDNQGNQQTFTNTLSSDLDQLKIDMNDKMDTLSDKVKAISEITQQAKIESLESKISDLENEVSQLMNHIKVLEDRNEENFDIIAFTKRNITAELDKITSAQQNRIISMEKKLDSKRLGDTSTQSNTSKNIKFKIPTFAATEKEKPMKFLRDLEKYLNAVDPDFDQFIYIISSALTEEAKEWWFLVESDINDFSDFEKKFKDYYWSSHIQRNLRKKIEFGKFNPKYDKSKTNYAIHWLGIAKELDYECKETDLIDKIADHFDTVTRQIIVNMPVKDTTNLLKLLADFDRERKFDQNTNTQNPPHSWQTNTITQENSSKKKSPKLRRKSIDNLQMDEFSISNIVADDSIVTFSGNGQ